LVRRGDGENGPRAAHDRERIAFLDLGDVGLYVLAQFPQADNFGFHSG